MTEGKTFVTEKKTLVTKGKTLVTEGKTLVTKGRTLVTTSKVGYGYQWAMPHKLTQSWGQSPIAARRA